MPRKKKPLAGTSQAVIAALDAAIHRDISLSFPTPGAAWKFYKDCQNYRKRLYDEGTPAQKERATKYYNFIIRRKKDENIIHFQNKTEGDKAVLEQLKRIQGTEEYPSLPTETDHTSTTPAAEISTSPPTLEEFLANLKKPE